MGAMPQDVSPQRLALIQNSFDVVQLLFAFAFGACLGSLVNVLAYRMPRGLGVVSPPSRCTSCGTRLTWRENFPVLGWILLRGRCRFCRSPISAEYPIVEALTGVLFALVYAMLFLNDYRGIGSVFAGIRPEWALAGGVRLMWPVMVVWLTLVTCLLAVTIIDARTFQIPLSLVWIPSLVGLVGHVGLALYVQYGYVYRKLMGAAAGWTWALVSPGPYGWKWVGAALGGIVGLGVGLALLKTGLIKRSFLDYAEWEARALKEASGAAAADEGSASPDAAPPGGDSASVGDPELWVQYPHARREMVRELIFLAPCIGLAFLGAGLAMRWAGPWTYDPRVMETVPTVLVPLWLDVLSGVILGYLVGGGVVWGVRILGSLAFGKEAMGLGDVHLMAAVGACLGWVDSALAFFGATFVGLGWWILGRVFRGVGKRHMPFGPYLAVSTILVMFAKPLLEWLLGMILHVEGGRLHLP